MADAEGLLRREVDRVLTELTRANPRALADNPEGTALLAEALHEALLLGLSAGAAQTGVALSNVAVGTDALARWQRVRELTPDGPAWPAVLAESAPATTDRARDLVLAAAQELGLHGRALRRPGAAGEQAAEAGASLVRVLLEPPAAPEPPRPAVPAAIGARQPDGTVRVGLAANESEADLLQGILAEAGIPSTWRRTGGDLPYLQGGGYREIYVPMSAADEARALLSTLEVPEAEPDDESEPTHRVGLERTGVRLIGKTTATYVALGVLFSAAAGIASLNLVLGVVALVAIVALGLAIVIWSERARR